MRVLYIMSERDWLKLYGLLLADCVVTPQNKSDNLSEMCFTDLDGKDFPPLRGHVSLQIVSFTISGNSVQMLCLFSNDKLLAHLSVFPTFSTYSFPPNVEKKLIN